MTEIMDKTDLLETALSAVMQGAEDYGTVESNFGYIASLWTAYGLRGALGKAVTREQVAMAMILLKVARHAYKPSRNNLVDIAGYAACAAELLPGDR